MFRLISKLLGFYPVLVEFENGKYGVRCNRIMQTYYDAQGDDWISKSNIAKYCMFDTLEEARRVYQMVTLKSKVIRA